MAESKKMKQLQAEYELEAKDICLGLLIAQGLNPTEAIAITHRPLGSLMSAYKTRICAKPKIKSLIDDMQDPDKARRFKSDEKDVIPDFTKDFATSELYRQYKKCTEPNKKADIMMKISDLHQLKKEEALKDEKKVTYYLPLKCNVCPWYKKIEKTED